jgi:cytoskeletal protein RodZ
VTRIPRKYLDALELENFGILPAPVYARGFLRSYAQYLSLNPDDLLPFFPVGHPEEPVLDPLPEVGEPRTWNVNSMVAIGVVGFLILLVVGLYTIGSDDGSPAFSDQEAVNSAPLVPAEEAAPPPAGPAAALPELTGLTSEEAIAQIEATGASYIIVGTSEGDFPIGQVIAQSPAAGASVGAGDLVTITVSQ